MRSYNLNDEEFQTLIAEGNCKHLSTVTLCTWVDHAINAENPQEAEVYEYRYGYLVRHDYDGKVYDIETEDGIMEILSMLIDKWELLGIIMSKESKIA